MSSCSPVFTSWSCYLQPFTICIYYFNILPSSLEVHPDTCFCMSLLTCYLGLFSCSEIHWSSLSNLQTTKITSKPLLPLYITIKFFKNSTHHISFPTTPSCVPVVLRFANKTPFYCLISHGQLALWVLRCY